MASIFQIGISRNTKCALKDGFRKSSHIFIMTELINRGNSWYNYFSWVASTHKIFLLSNIPKLQYITCYIRM